MSKIVSPKLLIDGSEFLPKSSYRVTISQSMGDHSAFRISFPANATEGYGSALMDNALKSVGKKVSIGLDNGELEFIGVVTSADLQKHSGAPGNLILSGYSPSILLSRSAQCKSYEEGTSLGQVITDTFDGHDTNLLKTALGNGTDIKLPYTVQYNEDDFSFVRRLCARYGVWMYDNGKALHVGRSGQGSFQGTYGENVHTFQLSANLQGRIFGVSSHDWVNDSLLESDASAYKAQGGHPYIDVVDGASETLFSKKGNYHWSLDQHEYSGQGGMDTAAKVAVHARTSAMVTASGSSELVSLCVGDTLTVEGLNFTDGNTKDAYGSYMVTKITHGFDHSGHYLNEFEGVPEGTEHPFYGNVFSAPFAQAQRGLVLDNADPEGLGRIKVQFGWQKPMGTSTPWIKMHTPYSGSGKGFYFIPEKDEEVLVGFEGNNPERPFVLSAGHSASTKSGFADPENNTKAIRTRSGHLIELNDTDGEESITITDKNSNKIFLDTKNSSISITAPGNLSLNADTIDIKAKNALTIKSEESTIAIASKDAIGMHSAEATVQISGKENVDMRSTEAEVKVKAKTNLNVVGNEKVDILSGKELAMHGRATSKLTGGEVHVNKG
ncbi:type VI secretion system Vgr family protein [Costertonia aggregata]|uniref:Type IV secretion protein Rhs n=1 Tax=Costertonia aggregata TaxID=343403 RepID=A0A7H9ATN2_9FLAO|nr:phage baseplate assembly protein V [Costertonia aggregata]QLG46843.1 type IV secretion protein Rhs [Costertonia aggregata]